MKHCILLIVSIAQIVLLTACWSSTPIENLNMEVAVALDVADETVIEKKFDGKGGDYSKRDRISATYQFIVPQGAVGSKKKGLLQEISTI